MMKLRSIAKTLLVGVAVTLISFSASAATLVDQCFDYRKAQDYPRAVQAGRDAIRQNGKDGAAYLCLGKAYESLGDLDLALKNFLQAEQLFSKKVELAVVYSNLGNVYSEKGDLQQALNYHSRSLGLFREIGDKSGESTQLNNVAIVFQNRGDLDKALDYFQQSINLESVDAKKASKYNNIATLYSEKEEYTKAIDYIDRAISTSRRAGDYHGAAINLLNKGSIQISMGNMDGASSSLDEGLTGVRKVGDKYWEAIGLSYQGNLAKDRGNVELAKSKYQEAMRLARSIGYNEGADFYARKIANLQRDTTTISYGVVEIGSKGVKAAVVSSYTDEQGRLRYQTGFKKSVNTDVIKGVTETGEFSPEAIEATAKAASDLVNEIRSNAKNVGDNIFVAGSSALAMAMNRDDLGKQVHSLTGIAPVFINSSQELTFALVGSVPDEYSYKTALLDIGSGNGRIGYLISPRSDRKQGQAAIDIRAGSVSLADLANKSKGIGENYITALNRVVDKEIAPRFASDIKQYPVLAKHKHLVIVGGAAWAMSSLMHPEDQGAYVALTLQDFRDYFERISTNPDGVLNPDLSYIKDPKIRESATKQIESVKKVFTVENLQAGARILKMVADTVPLGNAKIFFGRDGNWAYGLAGSIMTSKRLSKN